MTGKNRESSAAISTVLYHRLIYGVCALRVARASDAETANEDQGGANENHKEIPMGSRNEKQHIG